jgi:hypothetical protein
MSTSTLKPDGGECNARFHTYLTADTGSHHVKVDAALHASINPSAKEQTTQF